MQKLKHILLRQPNLVHMEQLKKIIEAVLITPYIKDENPISLMIVAKPESGKTSVMKLYKSCSSIEYLTDCTAFGIARDVLPKITAGQVKTIVIGERARARYHCLKAQRQGRISLLS